MNKQKNCSTLFQGSFELKELLLSIMMLIEMSYRLEVYCNKINDTLIHKTMATRAIVNKKAGGRNACELAYMSYL